MVTKNKNIILRDIELIDVELAILNNMLHSRNNILAVLLAALFVVFISMVNYPKIDFPMFILALFFSVVSVAVLIMVKIVYKTKIRINDWLDTKANKIKQKYNSK